MNEPLRIFFTKNFEDVFKTIPEKDQKRIQYDLTHMIRQDIQRMGYLKGDLNYVKKMNNGIFRIILAYCAECYENHRHKLNCDICDGNNLERIVAFSIHPRKKAYDRKKFQRDLNRIQF